MSGRVAALAALAALAGCDDRKVSPETASRSEAVVAKDTSPATSAPPVAPSASPSASHAPRAPRRLCDGELDKPGRRLPKVTFTAVAAPGTQKPEPRIATTAGRWTWINFFAAWCGPCKEEMPRLRAFQDKLAANLAVTFVSLDDDERQLMQLLGGQSEAHGARGVRSALWLEAGKGRSSFLTGLGMKPEPDLPAHVLVDPTGKVRCVLDGSIEDADLPAIAAIVAPGARIR